MFKVLYCKSELILRKYNTSSILLSNLAENVKTESHRSNQILQTKSKPKEKPLINVPFMKNLFVGKYDTNMLIFPEALEKVEVENINARYVQFESLLINTDTSIEDIKNSGLYGLKIPKIYGGLDLNATEVCRINELYYLKPDLFRYLNTIHHFVSQCIVIIGSDEQKELYLPKLAMGEITGALCISEPNAGSDLAMIEAMAILSEDEDHYLLNGDKMWVTNGPNANILIVFAKSKVKFKGKFEDKVSAFIVESQSEGIEKSEPYQLANFPLGEMCNMKFNNVKVPKKNLIHEEGNGYEIAFNTLNSNMYQYGSTHAATLKHISRDLVNHCIGRKQFMKSLKDFGLIQNKLSRITMNIYVMESLSYVTAGIIDTFQHPDIMIENAAVKVLSTELYKRSLADIIQILGCQSLQSNSAILNLATNALAENLYFTTDEILKLFISLSCLQHAGLCMVEDVKKFRNPLNNISFLWKKSIENFKNDRKILSKKLYNHVHPDLSHCGEALELRLQAVGNLVVKYWSSFGTEEMRVGGRGLEEQQFSLDKFADMAIDIFAATATLARATRSKAIGLKSCDQEVLIARTYAFDAAKRIDDWIAALDLGSFQNGDYNMIKMSEAMVKNSQYVPEHPLTRNW